MRNILLGASIVSVFLLAGCAVTSSSSGGETVVPSPPLRGIVFAETEFDFGVVRQSDGIVQHDFAFTYSGDTPIEIVGVPTSCACTSATVDRAMFNPGESGVLTVKFNPNLHEEPEGRFFKTVAVMTDPPLSPEPEVKIWVEIDLDLGPEAFELQGDHDDEEGEGGGGQGVYRSVMPEQFAAMLGNKDFLLVDVHIPEQEHIEGTDLFIPYNEIGENRHQLPEDEDTKIVVYCRSGGMSRAAAYTLLEMGYTNVVDVIGGKNAYDMLLESREISGSAEVGYIEVEALVVREANFGRVEQQFGDTLPWDVFPAGSTVVLLSLSNHRDNLAEYDYKNFVSLDGVRAEEWILLSSEMGGHHVAGILTFATASSPQVLAISGLPVGDVAIPLSPRAS